MIKKEKHVFKKGEVYHLDQIYIIQGLGGGKWWRKTGEDVSAMDYDLGEIVEIIENITITITVKRDKGD